MDDRVFARYLLSLLLAAVAVLSITAVAYVVTDPQGLIGTPAVQGINVVKPYLEHNRELARWNGAERLCPDAGIFGNSRAEIGFDPEHRGFATLGLSAYNHAIPGSGPLMARKQLEWLIARGCAPRLMIVGVDFADFLVDPTRPAPATASARSVSPRFDIGAAAETIFSLRGLRDVIDTLLAQRRPYAPTITPRGFNPLRSYIPEVERTGQFAMFRQRAEENLKVWRKQPRSVVGLNGTPAPEFEVLRSLLATATTSGTTVIFVIYPYHAQLRLMLDSLGYADTFDDWKRRVARLVEEARQTNPRVSLWDFSLISEATSEAIPSPGDRIARSRGYWEAGHFKRELGDRMLDQLLLDKPGFGVRIDTPQLDETLARDRGRVAALWRGTPLADDVTEVLGNTRAAEAATNAQAR